MEEVLVYEKPSDTGNDTADGARVILFNDEVHSFDEVIHQLIKATQCSFEKAKRFAETVHRNGKCEVYHGAVEDCLHVSAVLEEIHLKTTVDFS